MIANGTVIRTAIIMAEIVTMHFVSKISWIMFTLNMRHCIGICNLRWTVLHIDLGMSRDTFLQNLHNNYYVADILSCNGTCHWDCNFANIFLRKKYYLDHLASMASKASSFVRDLQKIFFFKRHMKGNVFFYLQLDTEMITRKNKIKEQRLILINVKRRLNICVLLP